MLNPYSANTYKGPTNYTTTLKGLKQTILNEAREDATTVVIMLSDGIPSTNEAGNNSATNKEFNGMDQAAELKQAGVKVITISVGQLSEAMQFYQPTGTRSNMTSLCENEMLLRMLGDQYYEGEELLHPTEVQQMEQRPSQDDSKLATEPQAEVEDSSFPWWIVIACAIIILLAGGITLLILNKKKENVKK
ncbi:MAG: hypothetical protein ACLVKR_01590 [Lachnospiraceae bacterium]